MRNFALVLGLSMLAASFGACINDPTLDNSTMSSTDTETVAEVFDTATETVVDSSTETATSVE